MQDNIRREARAAVDPIILKLRRELFGSGYFGRIHQSALPSTVVYAPQIPTEVSNAGFIRGVTTQQNAITVGVDQKTLNFSGFVVTSAGSVSTIQVPSSFQGITTQQNGVTVGTSQTTLNFSGFTITSSGSISTVQANPTGVTTQQEENTVGTSQTTLNFSGLIVTSNGSTSTILVPSVYSGIETRQNNTTVGTGQTVLNFSGLSVTSNGDISTVSVPSVYSGIETRQNNVVIGAGQTALNFSGFAASTSGVQTNIESAFTDAQIIQGTQPANPVSGRVRIWSPTTAGKETIYARFNSGNQRRLTHYAVKLVRTTQFNLTSVFTYITIPLPTVEFSSHTNISMSDGIGFVAPEAGIYYASATINVQPLAPTYIFISILHNTNHVAQDGVTISSPTQQYRRLNTGALINANANDTIRLTVFSDVTGNIGNVSINPTLSVFSL